MHCYKAFGLIIQSEILLPELSECEDSYETDLIIRAAGVHLPFLSKTKIFRRGVQAYFGKDDSDDLFLNWNDVAAYRAKGGKELVVATETEDNNLLSLFTVSEALGLILFQRNLFLLHSSAVVVGDEAWCFMGQPGAGKSTTAAAFVKAGCRLLSDDLTAIDFDQNGIPYVVPAYPQLKIWNNTVNGLDYDKAELHPVSEGVDKYAYQPKAEFSHEKVKLGKIIFLHKARNKKSELPLSVSAVPAEMLKNFPLPIALLADEALKAHFLQSLQCAKSAEILLKKRPDSFHNLEKWVEMSLASFSRKEEIHE